MGDKSGWNGVRPQLCACGNAICERENEFVLVVSEERITTNYHRPAANARTGRDSCNDVAERCTGTRVSDAGHLAHSRTGIIRCSMSLIAQSLCALRNVDQRREIVDHDCLRLRLENAPLCPLTKQSADGEQGRSGHLR